ncbi:MAG: Usg family protein [Geminicoccaceae bacterium]|nr:Usg family protein [Geminicoccaceae bacterium]
MTASDEAPGPLERQLKGYRLTTAEILYHMPDHPGLLQSFVWQHYDLAPRYPELRKFLDFWVKNIEGRLHAVHVARQQLIGPAVAVNVPGMWELH